MKSPTPRPPARRKPEAIGYWLWVPLPRRAAGRQRPGPSGPVVISGCDYLGLSDDPLIRRAWLEASAKGPLQTGASRATTGDHPGYRRAEAAIAGFLGAPAALLTATGYLASLAVGQGLQDEATHVLLDEGAHACVRDGARLGGLPVIPFASGHPQALASALGRLPKSARPLVATDGVHGIRGGMAPLKAYLEVLPTEGWLWVDDAHGIGAVGATGRGAPEALGLHDDRLIRSVTFSKALAVAGGAVIGPTPIVAQIRARAGAYLGSSAPPLAMAAAVKAALARVDRLPGRLRRFQALLRRFSEALPDRPEILNDPRTPVTAIHPRDADQARRLDEALAGAGFVPPWIQYPGGPAGGFFRIALRANHSAGIVDRLAGAIRIGLGA